MSDASVVVLRLDAPFSAWRWLQAGVFRGTFPVIPPSAAWGLVLNLAGIETRGSLTEVVTPIRTDAPALDIAVGVRRHGERSTLFQQLHSYPVGKSGETLKARTRGNKYWIAPVKREVLVGLIAVVGVRGPRIMLDRVAKGLSGELADHRYGLPFAGDNQFLFSDIKVVGPEEEAHWYEPVTGEDPARQTTRLTTNIDRGDASRTEAPLFAPGEWGPCPSGAWVRVGPVTATTS
jgi:CRISPR-associated protein Cas5t